MNVSRADVTDSWRYHLVTASSESRRGAKRQKPSRAMLIKLTLLVPTPKFQLARIPRNNAFEASLEVVDTILNLGGYARVVYHLSGQSSLSAVI